MAPKAEEISPKEYAAYRGVSVRTVLRWLNAKLIPGTQPAGKKGKWLIPWKQK